MKAFLRVTTFIPVLFLLNLPIVNGAKPFCGGKCIKASPYLSHSVLPPDSTESVFEPKLSIQSPRDAYRIRKVVIDPGHGGHDPGCLGAHSREKHLALAIGKYLAEGLKQKHPDVQVIMTRSEDVFVPLHERASIATRSQADLFISIHCNAFPKSKSVKGTETYVLGLHATEENLEVAKRENAAILLEENYQETYGYDPNSPEAHIVFSMFQNAFLEQSISFAEKVQHQSSKQAGMNDRGVKQAGFLVLRYATMPSVLVETGYLTNAQDENFLNTTYGQKAMATAILKAFTAYKSELEDGFSIDQLAGKDPLETQLPVTPVKLGEEKSEAPVVSGNPVDDSFEPKKTVRTVSADAYTTKLEIAPPSRPQPSNTNTSPVISEKKTVAKKIVPTVPVEASKPVVKKEPAVQFCVQLAASPNKLNIQEGKWLRTGHSIEVIRESGLFKYQVRNFASLNEANRVKSQLRAKGFSDAFVTAYKDGQKVNPVTLTAR